MINSNLKKNYDQGPDGLITAEEWNSIYSELKNIILTISNETDLNENNNFQLLKAIENIINRDSTIAVRDYYQRVKREIILKIQEFKQETFRESQEFEEKVIRKIKEFKQKTFRESQEFEEKVIRKIKEFKERNEETIRESQKFKEEIIADNEKFKEEFNINSDKFLYKLNFLDKIGNMHFEYLTKNLKGSYHIKTNKVYLYFFNTSYDLTKLNRDKDKQEKTNSDEIDNFFYNHSTLRLYPILCQIATGALYNIIGKINNDDKPTFLSLSRNLSQVNESKLLKAHIRNVLPKHYHGAPRGTENIWHTPNLGPSGFKSGSDMFKREPTMTKNYFETSDAGTEEINSKQEITIEQHPKPVNLNLFPVLVSDSILDFYGIDFTKEEFKRIMDFYEIESLDYDYYLDSKKLRKEMYKLYPGYGERMLKYMS